MESRGQRTIQMPACAIIAVPGAVRVSMLYAMYMRRNSKCTEDKIELYASSLLL